MSQRLATPWERRVLRPTGFFARLGQGAYIGSGGVHRVRGANQPKVAKSPFEDEDDDEDEDDRGGSCPPNDSKTGGKRWPSCDPGPVGGPDRPSVGVFFFKQKAAYEMIW